MPTAAIRRCSSGKRSLSTIHSAKGQEWRAVYVLNVVDGCIPSDLATGSAFVALGKPMPSLVLTLCRMVVVYLPLAMVGNRLFGYEGIYWAGAFANVLAGAVAVVWVGRLVPSTDTSISTVDLADA